MQAKNLQIEAPQETGYLLEPRQWQVSTQAEGGFLLQIQPGAQLNDPLLLRYRLDEVQPLLRDQNVIYAGANSQVTLLIEYTGEPGAETTYAHDGHTRLVVGPGAQVTVIQLQNLPATAQNRGVMEGYLEQDGALNWFSLEMGGAVTSLEHDLTLAGAGSQAQVKTLFLGDGSQKLDHGYRMLHLAPHTNSRVLSHGALKDESLSQFKAVLDIRTGAVKTVAEESQKVLLLDPTVRADAQPVLLCGEEDVRANHAASAGQLEESKLYYLTSRGLTRKEARQMIIEGSFRPLLDQIPLEAVRAQVEEEIRRRLIHGNDL